MTLEDLDRALLQLHEDVGRAQDTLLELELDPVHELLTTATLEGETAARWTQARVSLARVWDWQSVLKAHLDRADAVRGTRPRVAAERRAELERLLEEASVELRGEQVPMESRGLLDTSETVVHCTPAEALSTMSRTFEDARACVAAIGDAWDDLGRSLAEIGSRLTAGRQTSADLCCEATPRLDAAGDAHARLTSLLVRDPLAVTPASVTEVEVSVAAACAELDLLAEFRRAIAARLDAAANLLREVRATHEECQAAYREAQVKIAMAQAAEPPRLPDDLDGRLGDISVLVNSGAWQQAEDALGAWTVELTSLRDESRRVTSANLAPIDARNDLRGLLQAYRAKAMHLGLAEDASAAEAFRSAHAALYTAPTDVSRATALVADYGRIVSSGSGARGAGT